MDCRKLGLGKRKVKVNIGPYTTWTGPYQIADLLKFVGLSEDRCHDVGTWLCDNTPLEKWCNAFHKTQKRNIKVKIHDYDVWGADHTLALIIHPALVRLREKKHGSPFVNDEDVPENLRQTEPPSEKNDWSDDTVHERWEWVLNEMIWAFEQCAADDRNDGQFYHNTDQLTLSFEKRNVQVNRQKDPDKPGYWVDKDGLKAHYDRIQNGLCLFGKYYFGLWD